MTRKEIRNAEQVWRATSHKHTTFTAEPKRWTLKATTVLKLVAILVCMAALYSTSPARHWAECQQVDVPSYCVD